MKRFQKIIVLEVGTRLVSERRAGKPQVSHTDKSFEVPDGMDPVLLALLPRAPPASPVLLLAVGKLVPGANPWKDLQLLQQGHSLLI